MLRRGPPQFTVNGPYSGNLGGLPNAQRKCTEARWIGIKGHSRRSRRNARGRGVAADIAVVFVVGFVVALFIMALTNPKLIRRPNNVTALWLTGTIVSAYVAWIGLILFGKARHRARRERSCRDRQTESTEDSGDE